MDEETRVQAFIEVLSSEEKSLLLFHLLMKRQSDGLNGRTWAASLHLKHETELAQEIARISAQID